MVSRSGRNEDWPSFRSLKDCDFYSLWNGHIGRFWAEGRHDPFYLVTGSLAALLRTDHKVSSGESS